MRSAICRFGGSAFALAAAIVVTGAGGATARTVTWDHVFSAKGVTVYVQEHDDYVAVCDTAKNGHSAWVFVNSPTSTTLHYRMTVTAGKGRCEVHHAAEGSVYNMPENVTIGLVYAGNGEDDQWSYHTAHFLNDH